MWGFPAERGNKLNQAFHFVMDQGPRAGLDEGPLHSPSMVLARVGRMYLALW